MRLLYPIDKIYITQKFGERPDVYKQFGLLGHNGIDFRTRFVDSPLGKRYVTASAAGIIETIRWDIRGYGVHIRQRTDDGSLLIYGHLLKPYVQKGDKVWEGKRIGLTDNTGFSSGPHLHFEFRPKGISSDNGYAGAVDPLPYLKTI